jgi:hypothetical protein
MLTSQTGNCYFTLSQSTIFHFSLSPFLCIFHFRYNNAKRRIRGSTNVPHTVWKLHCNKLVVLKCEKSLWTILPFFLLPYFSFLFSYIYIKASGRFSMFSSLALVLLYRSTVVSITYENPFSIAKRRKMNA